MKKCVLLLLVTTIVFACKKKKQDAAIITTPKVEDSIQRQLYSGNTHKVTTCVGGGTSSADVSESIEVIRNLKQNTIIFFRDTFSVNDSNIYRIYEGIYKIKDDSLSMYYLSSISSAGRCRTYDTFSGIKK